MTEIKFASKEHKVERNSGDQVKRHSYPIGDSRIYGYGVPIYIN